MSSIKKSKSFWPIPGGHAAYPETLLKILEYINKNNPSSKDLTNYFLNNFDKVKSEQNAKGYVNNVIKTIGFVSFDNKNKLTLTDQGKTYLANKDVDYLFQVINENIVGFSEIIIAIGEGKVRVNDINIRVCGILKNYINWTSEYPVRYRIDWLRSIDIVTVKKGDHYLTLRGKKYYDKINDAMNKKSEFVIDKVDLISEQCPNNKIEEMVYYKCIINNLLMSEHDSDNPSKYEENIADAFRYLGFTTQHLGNSGDTDIYVTANVGQFSYSMIVDGKTSKHDKITERQISWPTIIDHKDAHDADYAIIVSPGFSGGDMIKRAADFDVVLFETSEMIKLIEMHANAPLNLIDLKSLFTGHGLLKINEFIKIKDKIEEYNVQKQLLPKIINELRKLHLTNEKTSIRDLYWSLGQIYSENKINQVLDLLIKLDLVMKDENNYYYALVSPEIAELKLRIFADLFKNNQ